MPAISMSAGRSSRWKKRDPVFALDRWRGDWSAPIVISTHHGLPRDDNGAVEGFSGTVARGRERLRRVGRRRLHRLHLVADGGKTFAQSRSVIETAPSVLRHGRTRPRQWISRDRHRRSPGQARAAVRHVERLSRGRYWRVLRQLRRWRQVVEQGRAGQLQCAARWYGPILPMAGRRSRKRCGEYHFL